MRTGRLGRVLETARLLLVGIPDQTRPLTPAIGRPLRRQTVGAVTLMAAAATRAGTARISRLRGRVGRREVITRMLPRITAVAVAAAGPMRRRRVLIRRRVGVILHQRGRTPHRPRPLAPIPLRAAVMAAEVEAGAAEWAADLLDLAARPRDMLSANQRVAASAFSIDSSSGALLRLYGEGALS